MKSRSCKTCGQINVAYAKECKSCGEPFYQAKVDDLHVDNRCAWSEVGQRCFETGIFSESTIGGGPWYCRRHERMRLGRGDPGKIDAEGPETRYKRRNDGKTFPELDRRGLVARIASQMTCDPPPKPQQIGDEVPW